MEQVVSKVKRIVSPMDRVARAHARPVVTVGVKTMRLRRPLSVRGKRDASRFTFIVLYAIYIHFYQGKLTIILTQVTFFIFF